VFTDVPENLPALLYARKLQRRATARAPEGSVLGVVGPEDGGPAAEAAVAKIERLERLRIEGASASPGSDPETRKDIELLLGDLLFSVVDLARRLRCDPELALRAAAERFSTSIAES
jgi:hypothetical protein